MYEQNEKADFFVAAILAAYARGEHDGGRAALDAASFIAYDSPVGSVGGSHVDEYSSNPYYWEPDEYTCMCGPGEGCSSCPPDLTVKDDYSVADAVLLESVSRHVNDLALRVGLIEKHYLGVEYRPDAGLWQN